MVRLSGRRWWKGWRGFGAREFTSGKLWWTSFEVQVRIVVSISPISVSVSIKFINISISLSVKFTNSIISRGWGSQGGRWTLDTLWAFLALRTAVKSYFTLLTINIYNFCLVQTLLAWSYFPDKFSDAGSNDANSYWIEAMLERKAEIVEFQTEIGFVEHKI